MKLNFITIAAIAGVALGGCGSKLAPLLEMPVKPQVTDDTIEVNLKFSSAAATQPDTVQSRAHAIPIGASIVINVPADLFKDISERDAEKQDYSTNAFFNSSEQQIEKVLIGKGFKVLSRSKFEAKLRKLRDENRCSSGDIRCLRSTVSPAVAIVLKSIEDKFAAGEIDSTVFATEIEKIQAELQTSSSGKTRTANDAELTDISEVIRAAESGIVRADYILQINAFDIKPIPALSNLLHHDKVRQLRMRHPEIKSQLDANSKIKCYTDSASLNAKLIYVKTGEIVWIGSHQLNGFSSGLKTIKAEGGSRTYIANAREVAAFIHHNNTEEARLRRAENQAGPLIPMPFSSNKPTQQATAIPQYQVVTKLVPFSVFSGSCEPSYTNYLRSKTSSIALPKQVAKTLMDTITVQ